MSEQITRKKCGSCGEEITFDASVCPKCGKYQSAWRNEALFFTSVLSLLSLFFAALSYTWSGVFLVFESPGIELISFRSDSKIILYNPSKLQVVVTQSVVMIGENFDNFAQSNDYYVRLEPREMRSIQINSGTSGSESPTEVGSAPAASDPPTLLCNADDRLRTLLTDADSDFVEVFAFKDDPDIKRVIATYKALGGKPEIEKCQISLSYFAAGEKPAEATHTRAFDCVALASLKPGVSLQQYLTFMCPRKKENGT